VSRLEEPAATELLQRLPAVELDDVAVRRLRRSVLADAALAVRPSAARPMQRTWGVGLRAVGALVALAAVLWSPRHEQGKETFAVVVRSSDGGPIRWSRRLDASAERVDLLDGAFRVEVRGGSENRHAIIGVPDGRIEDLGTTFEVRVEAGRTTRVHVEEGQVAVWVRGASALLVAGETWQPAAAPVERSSSAPPPSSGVHRVRPRPVGVRATSTGGAAPEDAAYLEILHLLRTAHSGEAREAARQYLRRFPEAFRRSEVERLAK
jgi:hypothetical protein